MGQWTTASGLSARSLEFTRIDGAGPGTARVLMLDGPDTGEFARELRRWRKQRGMTQRVLADRMAYHHSRVSQVEAGDLPHAEFARQADTILGAGGALWALYAELADARDQPPAAPERDLRTTEFVAWLADHAETDFATLYGAVCDAVERLERERPSVRYGRDRARRAVTQAQLAAALARYYGNEHMYRARVGSTEVVTGVACRPDWLTVAVDLRGGGEAFRYVPPTPPPTPRLSAGAVATAVARLASVEANETVMVNNPLYRLVDVEVGSGRLAATVTTVPFAHHALTTELMEGEMVDAVAAGLRPLPLRAAFLPTIESVFDLGSRACVGGAASLLAIARSARHSGQRDYVLLTQERSKAVLNTAGKLAVIPKAFHQPTGEPGDEAPISVTIRREFEEELLGRQDLEQIGQAEHAHVDLLHAQHLTEPMAWLLDQGPDAYRVECTGLGFNTLTSNYEFPCLIVIEDETWWDRFGHMVEANWEADRVHRHSSLDAAGLEALIGDPRWGNESLFALLQGLRRLAEVGDPQRVAIPTIDLEG